VPTEGQGSFSSRTISGVVAQTCDRVAVLYGGVVAEEADVYALFDEPKHPYTQALLQSMPRMGDKAPFVPIPGSSIQIIGELTWCPVRRSVLARHPGVPAGTARRATRRRSEVSMSAPARWSGMTPATTTMGADSTHRYGARLEVRNLSKSFKVGSETFGRSPRVKAVDGVSFSIQPGTTMGLVGESGSGKTTVARMITRLVQPDEGEVLVDGQDVLGRGLIGSRRFSRLIQIVFQDPTSSLNPRWKVGRLIGEGISVHKLRPRSQITARVAELVERCGLPANALGRFPHEFSGGQRQRIAIARALAVEPSVLVLDEPVSALDVSVQAQILVLLQELQRDFGLTYLLIAHDLAVVERFCDHIAVMKTGQIVETGDPSEVHRNPRHPYTRALVEAHPVPDPHRRAPDPPLRKTPRLTRRSPKHKGGNR
jgi:ABC-type glutathione transport system ATPase component